VKKILLVNDFSQLPTGYGMYGKHLLEGLSKKYEVAELACYINQNDDRIGKCNWPVFPNKPLDKEGLARYKDNPTAEYGDFSFNSTLLKWKPTHVINITDPWAFEFVIRSPLRDYFSHVLMPTVDATPNMSDWIDYYAQAEALLAYSEFGRDTMLKQCPSLNFIGVASPSVSKELHQKSPGDRSDIRKQASVPNGYIIGTVMRNQPRKLYADLFEAFAGYLKESGRKDVFLYCHTGFPDLGWNMPELLMEYELTNRVLFTYKCKNCGAISVRFFSDAVCHCEECGRFTNCISGTNNGVTETELCYIYNMMDAYIQVASNEGFGIPVVEAAACGLPIAAVNYSAMSSVLDNLDGFPIRVESLSKEASTGRMLAKPCHDSIKSYIKMIADSTKEKLFQDGSQMEKICRIHYTWKKTIAEWGKAIENARPPKSPWDASPRIFEPGPFYDLRNPLEQTNYLIKNVLGRPEMCGGQLWRRLIKDLTYNTRIGSYGNFYFNEMAEKDSLKHSEFSFQDAYNEMLLLNEYFNTWERHRVSTL